MSPSRRARSAHPRVTRVRANGIFATYIGRSSTVIDAVARPIGRQPRGAIISLFR